MKKYNKIKLNCDMGESLNPSVDSDAEIMPYIDMANLACGFHAGDPLTMYRSVKLACEHGVEIGAHPSYADLEGFGRREMVCSEEEIISLVLYQCGALDAICKLHGTKISYVKPHGALYNIMMKEMPVFSAICKAVSAYDANIPLMILSTTNNPTFAKIAQEYNVSLLYEVFADRAYSDDGFLVSRKEDNAVLTSVEEVLERAKLLVEKGLLKTISGKEIVLKADTLCVHGDNEEALALVKALRKSLE